MKRSAMDDNPRPTVMMTDGLRGPVCSEDADPERHKHRHRPTIPITSS